MQYIDPADQATTVTPTGPPGGPSASPTPTYTPSAAGPGVAPPPAAGPDSIQTSPGYTPDYTGAIQNDPGYAGATAANQQAQATAAAARRAALQQQVIQYGGMPDGFKDAYGDIDQATLDAAKGNQYSSLAAMQKNYQSSVDQFRKALAARGALQSGDLNYGQDQLDYGLGQSQYDAGNAFGGAAAGTIGQYTGVLDANQQRLAGAIQGAEANAFNDPANRPTQASTAQRDAGKSSAYGQDIYTGADGTLYTRDGSVFTPPSASAAPTYNYDAGFGRGYVPAGGF